MLTGQGAEAAVSYDIFLSICWNQVALVICFITTPKLTRLNNKYFLFLTLSVGQPSREGSGRISCSIVSDFRWSIWRLGARIIWGLIYSCLAVDATFWLRNQQGWTYDISLLTTRWLNFKDRCLQRDMGFYDPWKLCKVPFITLHRVIKL